MMRKEGRKEESSSPDFPPIVAAGPDLDGISEHPDFLLALSAFTSLALPVLLFFQVP